MIKLFTENWRQKSAFGAFEIPDGLSWMID